MNGRALPTNRPTPVEHNFPIVEVFSAIFSQLCECADKRFQDYPQAHRQHLSACGTVLFEAAEMPSIGIGEYIRRIKQYSECSTECFIVSLIYIDRLIANHEGFALHSLNFHRLFLTSAMMSTKFYEDVYYNNAFWSRVGGVSLNEINAQELHFLRLIEWQFSVPKTLYDQYYTELVLFAEREGLLPDDFVPPIPHTKPPTVVSSTACFSPDLQPLDVFLPVSQDPLPSLPSASPDSELTRMLTSASHIAQKSYALAAASSAAPPTTNGVHHNHHNHHLHPQVSSAASASTSSGFPEFTSPILRSLPSRRLSQDLTILTQGPSLQHSSSATTHAAPPTATPAPLAAPTATPAPVPISNHVKPTLMVSAPTVPTSSTMPSASHPPHLAPSTYSHPHPHHPSVSAVGQTASQLQSKLVALSSTSSSSTSAHPHPAPSVSSSGMHLGSRTSAGTRSRRRRLARKKRMAAGKSSSSSSMGLSMGPNGNSSGTMPSSTSSSAAKGMETKRSADNSMMMMSSSSPARAHASGFSATAPSASSSSSAALFPTTGEMVFNSFSAHENPFEHNGFVFQPTALSSASMAQSEVSDLSARSAISEVSGDPHEGMCTPSWHGDIREGDDEYDEDDLDDESQDELAEEEEDEEESSEHELTRVHHQYHPYPQRHRRTHSEALRSSGGLGASSADLPILRSVSNSAVEGLATLAVDHPTSESEAMMDVDHHEAVLPSASTHTTAPLPLLPTVVSASNFVRPSVSIEAVGEPISATIALDHSLAHVPAVMSTELTATPLLPASTASYADPSGPLSHRSAGGSSHMMMQNSTTAGIHIHGTGAGAGAGGTGAGVVGGSDHHNPRLRSSVRRKSMSPRTPASALLFFERSPPCRRRVLKWRTKQPAYRTSTDESEASDLSSSPSPREDLKVAAAPSSSAPSGGSYHR